MSLRSLSTLVVAFILLLPFSNCTKLEKLDLRETVAGNPFVEIQFVPFNEDTVDALTLCISSLVFRRPESGTTDFPIEASQKTIDPRGVGLGSANMSTNVFIEAELEVSDTCGGNHSIQFTNSSGLHYSRDTMRLKFSGYAQVGITRTTIGFDIQNLIIAFNSVTADSEIQPVVVNTVGNFSSTGEITPAGRPVCASWVHDLHQTLGPDGLTYPTWHPQIDPVYGCVFGHEHGSDPRSFVGFSEMPAFGYASGLAAIPQSHNGFKVSVVNDDGRGKAWMVVAHQGSAGPERATEQFHEVSVHIVDTTPSRVLLAKIYVVADFGTAVSQCGVLPAGAYRAIPRTDCSNSYESWMTTIDIGAGTFRAMPTFGILNSTTRIEPINPLQLVAQDSSVCGSDPFGWYSACKGDVREFVAPSWVLANSGATDTFVTDAFGTTAGTGITQMVRRGVSIDESGERTGSTVKYVMDDSSNGGIYRRQDFTPTGLSVGFEIGPFTVRWKN